MSNADKLKQPNHLIVGQSSYPIEDQPTYTIQNLPSSVIKVASHPDWDRVIRVAEQIRLMGVGRTQFYELARAQDFPKEIVLGKRARGRWLSEMIDYIDSRKHRVPIQKEWADRSTEGDRS